MKGIVGRKIGMTQIFTEDKVIPVTVLKVSPCIITQVKTEATDGYDAIQIGMVEKTKDKKINKPMKGHMERAGNPSIRRLFEIRCSNPADYSAGGTITIDTFQPEEYVDVVGKSKGKGFQGVMKRHNFRGGNATHGSMFHRAPGSIGASSYPSRVWKGIRMPGRMGNKRITMKNLKVVKVDLENNLLYLRGAVPGPNRGYLLIKEAKRGGK